MIQAQNGQFEERLGHVIRTQRMLQDMTPHGLYKVRTLELILSNGQKQLVENTFFFGGGGRGGRCHLAI